MAKKTDDINLEVAETEIIEEKKEEKKPAAKKTAAKNTNAKKNTTSNDKKTPIINNVTINFRKTKTGVFSR